MKSFKNYLVENALQEMANPLMVPDKELAKLDNMLKTSKKDKQELVADLLQIYGKYKPKLEQVLSKFKGAINSAGIRKYNNVKFLAGLKPEDSIIDKAIDRKKGLTNLNDLVRGAVLFDTKADADDFVKRFMRNHKSIVSGYEEKAKGLDKTYGYFGSHHIDLNIDGIIVELQIMTKKMWNYKSAAHDIYTKNRSSGNAPSAFDQHNSKSIFALANRERRIREDVEYPEIIKMEFSLDEMTDFCPDAYIEVV